MSDVTSTTSRGPSRRAVVRTAAHAAWAVPAIQVATSVPAFAAVSKEDVLLTGTPTQSYGTFDKGKRPITVGGIVVQNDGPNALTNRLELTLIVSSGWHSVAGDVSNGWSVTSVSLTTLTIKYSGTVDVGTATAFTTGVPGFTVIGSGQNATITSFSAALA